MKLEEYIRKIRPEMDVEKTDEDVLWTGISEGLKKKRSVNFSLYMKIAASLIVFLAISIVVKNQFFSNQSQQLIFVNIDPELAKQEAQYIEVINAYYKTIKKSKYSETDVATNLSQIDEIDTLIKMYSNDLEKYGPDPEILNTLMDLYQKKIKIFDRMLNEIQKQRNHENKERSL